MIKREALATIAVAASSSLIVCTAILFMALNKANERADTLERQYELATEHWGSKSGGTTLLTGDIINYNLKTFDSGKTWYAVEIDREWGMTIIGEAEDVYPGLLDHIKAWNALTEYVEQNGPITELSLLEQQLLNDIGLEVKEK